MSSSISFNGIPATIRVPGTYVEISNSRAVRGLFAWPARALLAGQRLVTGVAVSGVPVRVTSAEQARTLFGRGSMLAHQAERWFAANGGVTETWALAIDDNGSGVQATGSFTVGGTATGPGSIAVGIGGRRAEIGVAAGNTAAATATALAAAINALPDLAVTAAAAAAVVTVTARHRGIEPNGLRLQVNPLASDALPAGLTLTAVQMSGGTLNPNAGLQAALDAIGDTWFTDLVHGWSDAGTIAVIEAWLTSQWGPMRMRDGHAWGGLAAASLAAATTYGAARNSPLCSTVAFRNTAPTPAWEWASAFAGVCIPALAIDPARPVQTLAVPGVQPPPPSDRWSQAERELLLRDGLSTWTVDGAGGVSVERVVTNYQTAPSGAEDTSYLDVETMKTLAFLRFDVRQFVALRYPRHKLADDGTKFARGQAVVTPGTLRADLVARALQWEEAGLVENIEQFRRDLVVVRNGSDPNRVDALLPPDLVNQFRVLAAQIQFLL